VQYTGLLKQNTVQKTTAFEAKSVNHHIIHFYLGVILTFPFQR